MRWWHKLSANKLKRFDFSVSLIVLIIIILFLAKLPLPSDDLLRDMIASDYGYDYSNLYLYAPLLAKYNQYIGFDRFLHFISGYFGKIYTIRLVQLGCLISYLLALSLVFKAILSKRPDKSDLVAFLLAYTMIQVIMNRIALGRPEVILSVWVLFGFASSFYSSKIYKIVWVILGIFLIPFYWLAFLYTPACLVVFSRIRYKILCLVGLLTINVIGWQILSNWEWFVSLKQLHVLMNNRLSEINVGENQSILFGLLFPQVGLVLYLILFRFQLYIKSLFKIKSSIKVEYIKIAHSKIFWYSILFVWFTISDMIRYLDVVFPILMIIFVLLYREYQFVFISTLHKNLLFLLSLYLILMAQLTTHKLPQFKLPNNSRILTAFDGSNYSIPFFNKEVRVAPAMEIGANDRGVQQLVIDIQKKNILDCRLLAQYDFDYLVEKNLVGMQSCLELVNINGDYRLWKIKKRSRYGEESIKKTQSN
ncbi:MAG: hypothetical protein K2P99_01145 [Burkholderiales bacterium]|nr:hypothetical protein [Burkholderiales bacterium]